MSQRIDLDRISTYDDTVLAVVTALDAGQTIAIPEEVGVLVLGMPGRIEAGENLRRLKERIPESVDFLAMADASFAEDYVDANSVAFEKLSRRCWPGPVVLKVGRPVPDRLTKNWHESIRGWGLNEHGRSLGVPGYFFSRRLLENLTGPALGLLIPGMKQLPEETPEVQLIVDSSEVQYPEGPTVVRIVDGEFEIDRSGVVSRRVLDRMTGEVYLFVCTGNTCRSPMAEGLFRRMLSIQQKCQEDELLDRGFTVISAGLSAYPGAPAASDAVELLKLDGIDLSAHESQPVTEELLFHSDHILAMTQNHLDTILHAFPELAGKARLLSQERRDISDPIGGGPEEYTRCRGEIERHLKALLPQQSSG